MPLEIEFRKTTNIPPPIYMHRKLSKEIHNRRRTIRQRKPQHKRRQHNADNLLHKDHDLHREQLPKLLMHLLAMELVLPFVRHVVRVSDHFRHEELWIEHPVLFRDHAPCGAQNTTKETEIEEHSAVGCDFKVEEEVGVQDGGEHEDCSERARDESYKSIDLRFRLDG